MSTKFGWCLTGHHEDCWVDKGLLHCDCDCEAHGAQHQERLKNPVPVEDSEIRKIAQTVMNKYDAPKVDRRRKATSYVAIVDDVPATVEELQNKRKNK